MGMIGPTSPSGRPRILADDQPETPISFKPITQSQVSGLGFRVQTVIDVVLPWGVLRQTLPAVHFCARVPEYNPGPSYFSKQHTRSHGTCQSGVAKPALAAITKRSRCFKHLGGLYGLAHRMQGLSMLT